MEFKKAKLLILTITIFFILVVGSFWVREATNSTFTFTIAMDDETRDYLIEHDYCILSYDAPIDSVEASFNFLGDCEYLNTTLGKITK